MSWLGAVAKLSALRPSAKATPGACTRRHASGCSACAEVCPKGAISTSEEGVEIDAEACVGCGLCVVACPVAAIEGAGQSPVGVATRIERGKALRCDVARALRPEGEGEFADVPCVAGVDPEAIAAGALAGGGATVVRGPCSSCPLGVGERVRSTIDRARVLVDATPVGARVVEEEVAVVEPEPRERRRGGRKRAPDRASPEVSRRVLFGLRPQPGTAAAGEPESVFGALGTGASAREVLLASTEEPALPRLEADLRCTACGGCVRVCPKDALSLKAGTLVLSPVDCVACGECVRVCPEGALSFAAPEPVSGAGRLPLVHVAPESCSACGRPLGPGETGRCHNCESRASLLDGIWAQLG